MAPPRFFTIASAYYPGYNVVQRGSHIVLAAENLDNPFQLWYKDDSWRYLDNGDGNPSFALINNGSKAALKTDVNYASSKLSAFTPYDPSENAQNTTLWNLNSSSNKLTSVVSSFALSLSLDLGLGSSPPESGDGVAVILQKVAVNSTSQQWQFKEYVPSAYIIQSYWVSQILVTKNPHEDVTFTTLPTGTFNDELTVVAVYSTTNKNGDREVWYKVPARGVPQDSNSSFIVISKSNGKALKGSTKPGDKVIATEFDPLDDNFVWSENRLQSSGTNLVAINLANGDTTLHWHLPNDAEYQNKAYYHPLTLRKDVDGLNRQQWQFIPFVSS